MAVRRLAYLELTVLFFYFSITTLIPDLAANFENLGYKNVAEQSYLERRATPWSTLFENPAREFTKTDVFLKGGNKQNFSQNMMRSNQPSSYYLSGVVDLMEGGFDIAIVNFQTEFSLSPERDMLITFLLGTAYALSGNQEEAIQTWRQYPEIASYFLRIGSDSLYNNHNSELAINYFRMANEVDPSNCEVSYRMGIALLAQGDKTQALDIFEKINPQLCSNEFLGEVYYQQAKMLADSGQLDKAIKYARQSLNLNRDDAKRIALLGILLSRSGKNLDEASVLLVKALQLNPADVWNYVNLCNLYRYQRNYSEALLWCRNATKSFPENAVGFQYTGQVYLDAKNYIEAIKWFSKASELDSTNVNTWKRLGDAYLGAGEKPNALDAYRTVLRLSPDEPYAQRSVEALLNDQPTGDFQK